MSTCQGAPAPHLNCRYGIHCDWNNGQRTIYHPTSFACDYGLHPACAGACGCKCHKPALVAS